MPTYDGFLLYQRPSLAALPLFVFAASAKEILTWARILETAKIEGAAQRLEKPSHIKSIRSYIRAAPVNIIPPSVTLAIESGRYTLAGVPPKAPKKQGIRIAKLTINTPKTDKDKDKPAFVIDGQHRLKAIAAEDVSMPLVASIILGANQLERALHFMVINSKAKRVSSDLVRGIVAELQDTDREQLGSRLVSVGMTLGDYPSALAVLGNNPESPFYKLIDWDINREPDGNKRVKPQALEASLRVILADLETPDKLDIDDAVELVSAMWRGVAEAWGRDDKEWHDDDSKLADKAGMVAVTEFLVERLNLKREDGLDVTDPDKVQEFCRTVMSAVVPEFWILPWNKKELDTSAGRSLIKQSLSELRTAVASKRRDPLAKVPLLRSSEGAE